MDDAVLMRIIQAVVEEPPSERFKLCLCVLQSLLLALGHEEEELEAEVARQHDFHAIAVGQVRDGAPAGNAVLRDVCGAMWHLARLLHRAEGVEAELKAEGRGMPLGRRSRAN